MVDSDFSERNMGPKIDQVVVTFGTFDVFHVGHLNILERARSHGGRLIVGVSSDELNRKKKGRYPVFAEAERARILGALRCVDTVFLSIHWKKSGGTFLITMRMCW